MNDNTYTGIEFIRAHRVILCNAMLILHTNYISTHRRRRHCLHLHHFLSSLLLYQVLFFFLKKKWHFAINI